MEYGCIEKIAVIDSDSPARIRTAVEGWPPGPVLDAVTRPKALMIGHYTTGLRYPVIRARTKG